MLAVVLVLPPAGAQEIEAKGAEKRLPSAVAVRYLETCRQHGIHCLLDYGNQTVMRESKEPSVSRIRFSDTPTSNLTLIIILSLGFVAILLLWFYFGSGGVLLSNNISAREKKTETPQGWFEGEEKAAQSVGDFFQQMAAMVNKQEALVQILRYCLLHGAQISQTKLARSDTERLVLRRLPENLPQRSHLETLLHHAELAHYGGVVVEEQHFTQLLGLAQDFVQGGQASHA